MSKNKQSATILLVEDNAGDALLFTTIVRNQDPSVKIVVATNGEAALDVLFSRKEDSATGIPDVVVLDINLPRKNGFEVLKEIRESPLGDIPVFMLTGSNNPDDAKRGHALNVVSFITKPTELNEFVEIIDTFLTKEIPQALKGRT